MRFVLKEKKAMKGCNLLNVSNNSDEYVEINLNRKVTELSSVSYEKNYTVFIY